MSEDFSLLDLFRIEAESHSKVLEQGLVSLESDPTPSRVEPLMRAAHSIKGAARIVGLNQVVSLAHAMEDVLQAIQQGFRRPETSTIDQLLRGTDLFAKLAGLETHQMEDWIATQQGDIDQLAVDLRSASKSAPAKPSEPNPAPSLLQAQALPSISVLLPQNEERTDLGYVRVQPAALNELLGLAGECLIQARSAQAFVTPLHEIKRLQMEIHSALDRLGEWMAGGSLGEEFSTRVQELMDLSHRQREQLFAHLENFGHYVLHQDYLAGKLNDQLLQLRMRPFSDGATGFPRLVRDVAQALGKRATLRIRGESVLVDRDILQKLEAPINHLLRNALDHGLEEPDQRMSLGKTPEGHLELEANHRSGRLVVTLRDDGRGIDLEMIRQKVIDKGLIAAHLAPALTHRELFDFLFLPGFSTAQQLTEFSGRGVGLDVVNTMVQEVGGSISVQSDLGSGTVFQLLLPLTLSMQNVLLVDIDGEPYGIPLSRIDHILSVDPNELKTMENRPYVHHKGELLAVVEAAQVLGLPQGCRPDEKLPLVLLSDGQNHYAMAVDRWRHQATLVLRPLDPRLGKIPNISAGAILEDGTPLLVLDVEDLVRSISTLAEKIVPRRLQAAAIGSGHTQKRILVVEDSLTVREVERQLLENHGYEVMLAVDGQDGWNKLFGQDFDLVITDVDMPRMNGIELVSRIRQDSRTRHLPVLIVSYKDREEDRLRGLEAGANYYLAKSGFHDSRLLEAVEDLIGRIET